MTVSVNVPLPSVAEPNPLVRTISIVESPAGLQLVPLASTFGAVSVHSVGSGPRVKSVWSGHG